jgi:hypothetical protein
MRGVVASLARVTWDAPTLLALAWGGPFRLPVPGPGQPTRRASQRLSRTAERGMDRAMEPAGRPTS